MFSTLQEIIFYDRKIDSIAENYNFYDRKINFSNEIFNSHDRKVISHDRKINYPDGIFISHDQKLFIWLKIAIMDRVCVPGADQSKKECPGGAVRLV